MPTHSKLSCSSSSRWLNCPGSTRLIDTLNLPDTSSKYADEGSVAHQVHDYSLLFDEPANRSLGEKVLYNGEFYTVTQEMADAIQVSLDYINDTKYIAELEGYTVNLFSEVRSSLEYLNVPGMEGGTADVVILFWQDEDLKQVEIVDYKHGEGTPVDIKNNSQLMMYALGVCRKYDVDKEITVKQTIIQPRCVQGGEPIRSTTGLASDLYKWEPELVRKALNTLAPNVPLTPSDTACRWCLAKSDCSARYALTQQAAMVEFSSIEAELPSTEVLTTDQKLFIMRNASNISKFLGDVAEKVKSEVNAGSKDYSQYYKLVKAKTNRKLKKDLTPLLNFLTEDEVYKQSTKTLGDIEKALKEVTTKDEFKEVMDKVTEKPEGKPTLVPTTDKRKEIQPSIISDFDNV